MLLNTSTAIEMSRRLAWALSQCRWSGATGRNHRRTVDSRRSIRTAMRRNPRPFALCVNAFPMTAVVSARRTCSSAGNSTWVLVHAVQRARAGCTVTVLAPDPRTVRMRPCPHLVRTPPHSAHAIAPDARCLWASAAHRITITAADSAHGCSVLLGTTLPHEITLPGPVKARLPRASATEAGLSSLRSQCLLYTIHNEHCWRKHAS
jgi:hypothetical protein